MKWPVFHKNPLHALSEKLTWVMIAAAIGGWGAMEDGMLKHYLLGAATICSIVAAMMTRESPYPSPNEQTIPSNPCDSEQK